MDEQFAEGDWGVVETECDICGERVPCRRITDAEEWAEHEEGRQRYWCKPCLSARCADQ